ncbi:zinc finger BED domain-containing protein 4-like [Nothobranchius furzeri]|uniref:zinc finger BED domain-containing protein 4-like n=1 Tax=Nothobranchius furzeri TaxID=105023 RepID=UPI0039049A76
MEFMKITTEVVQMNGEEKGSDTAMSNEDQATGTCEEDQTAGTESDKSPSREDKNTDDAPLKKKTAMDQMFGDFLSARPPTKTIREKAKDEILKYRERDTLGLDGDVLQWWRLQVDLPLLSALAKRYLSIPATSVPAERVFSTAGDIVTAQRSLLHPDHVNQLIFLKKNL